MSLPKETKYSRTLGNGQIVLKPEAFLEEMPGRPKNRGKECYHPNYLHYPFRWATSYYCASLTKDCKGRFRRALDAILRGFREGRREALCKG